MQKHFFSFGSLVFTLVFIGSLSSCGSGEENGDAVVSDSSASPVTHTDTVMPQESVKKAVAATDSVTPYAQNTTEDSIGSKLSIHHGKVKVVDTTKQD